MYGNEFITKNCILASNTYGLLTLYNILTYIAAFHVKLMALFNAKLKLGVDGRLATFERLKQNISATDKTIWFHCASLGEYEQGLPVFEAIKIEKPHHKIILSFFSPSGFEVRKNSPIADVVVYLPLDTKKNAKTFIDLIHPDLVLFVKYEIWPNYLQILHSRQIKCLLISALFRKDQIYFKPYGKLMRQSLLVFDHIFVQDQISKQLLESIQITPVSISGDTRFDRVSNQLKMDNSLQTIEQFKANKICIVIGSSWPEDEAIWVEYINSSNDDAKFIIAPHNIKAKQIANLTNQLTVDSALYSAREENTLSESEVLIIDNVGILSKIYNYADIAYIGGAIGKTGLHNTLEPAVFGAPIIIGPRHSKFPEASEMISKGGMFVVSNQIELRKILGKLIDDKMFRLSSGKKNSAYIKESQGAVIQIMSYIRTYT